jgi:hypothetical protein
MQHVSKHVPESRGDRPPNVGVTHIAVPRYELVRLGASFPSRNEKAYPVNLARACVCMRSYLGALGFSGFSVPGILRQNILLRKYFTQSKILPD